MNKIEVLKLVLDALESCGQGHISDGGNQWHNEKLVDEAIEAVREALANEALDRMAENARELGLDYEPARPYRQLQDNGSKYFGESWDKAEQPAQQQGWRLVPYDPSIDMQEHGSIASGYDVSQTRAKKVYQAMIDMHDVMMEREPTDEWLRLQAGYTEQPAQQQEPATKDVVIDNMGKPFTVKAYVDPQPAQQDEFKAAYIEAMSASNKAGFSGMTAAETIRELSRMVSEQPAPVQQEPVAWMEMVVANLVREGVNKHKARELAQHFYTSPQPAQQEPADSMGMPLSCGKPLCSPGDHHTLCSLAEQPAQRKPLMEEEMFEAIRPLYSSDKAARLAVSHSKDEYRAIETVLRRNNENRN